jgi:hypothetical protein
LSQQLGGTALERVVTAALAESATTLPWWRADPKRLDRERRLLRAPWHLRQEDDRYVWSGGTLQASNAGLDAPGRAAQLIYPLGFPARFMEVRLIPDPPCELWGVLGTHLNHDGSACCITGESWTPQMTVKTTLALALDWWFNYWVIVENNRWALRWPDQGRVTVPRDEYAAIHHR